MRYSYDTEIAIWTVADETGRPEAQREFPRYSDPFKQLRFPALQFSVYDPYEGTEVECPNCGEIHSLERYGGDYQGDCLRIECTGCNQILAFIWFATKEEAEWAGDQSTVKMFEIMDRRTQRFKQECLRSPKQLPEIDELQFTLEWHTQERRESGGESYTLIKYNGTVIFRELAFYENGSRYGEVARILKARYGDRLKDLVPTQAGWLYLGGDSFASLRKVEDARNALFGV
jgi:hypothetical protein